tara:strand:+ start:13570 stop:13884 length:315 start_codon:yes stop_codon:yes gene_type:complete
MKTYTLLIFIFILATGCSDNSSKDTAFAIKQCENFIKENMKVKDYISLETKTIDTWGKNGNIVIDMGYRNEGSDGPFTMRLCVIDLAKGLIEVPGVFGEAQWKK